MSKLGYALLSCLLMSVISGCAKSPTGRNQITLFSEEKMATMGAQSFEEMKQQLPISKDKKLTQFVQCVADAITPYVAKDAHNGDWEVVLFDSEQINAFALPGGKIGVYTGILQVTENQHQLAAIMGHEVGHVIANHSNERMSSSSLAQTGLQVINIGLSTQDPQTQSMVMAGLGLGVQYGVLMPYGRSHEKEADIIGQNLMAQAGFNPQAAVKLWRNMAKASAGSPPEFMSTHPSHETRIKKLTENLTKTEPLYKASKQKPNCSKS
ncbi:M48 family metallopeptidase [Psychrosphaera ytuae]|uniref:M48 family metallopeptidase n=1 Tax=Psychrosphaera ytuae TaxID=2820710 RepID=A0A975DAN5_9GAMM|nr:M48 family metallopeptidase [Psychrosphaera ytuae]QTH62801.1 M48 family metallopeptidase [Psychrosphaera ytuae]